MTMTAPATARTAALPREVAMRLAATEYTRFVDLLRALGPADWTRPTDCTGWDVRDIAAHTLGMVELAASLREQIRQNRAAARRQAERGGPMIDALTGLQVQERATMMPQQIIDRLVVRAPRATAGRRRIPAFVRRRRLPVTQEVGDAHEDWTIGYLTEVILTRDTWMHRADVARATGARHLLTPEHDGVIVADVVDEWAGRHGKPFALHLTGAAGGDWHGDGEVEADARIDMDAVDFCRALSGRGTAEGLLATAVPF